MFCQYAGLEPKYVLHRQLFVSILLVLLDIILYWTQVLLFSQELVVLVLRVKCNTYENRIAMTSVKYILTKQLCTNLLIDRIKKTRLPLMVCSYI